MRLKPIKVLINSVTIIEPHNCVFVYAPSIGGAFLFGVCMTEFQNITNEIRQLQIELNHTGSCTTKGLTEEEIAHLDERFFLAIEKLALLKGCREKRILSFML